MQVPLILLRNTFPLIRIILFLSNNEFNNNYCKINTDIEPDGFDESAVRALGGAICNDAMININNVQGVNNKAEYGGLIMV